MKVFPSAFVVALTVSFSVCLGRSIQQDTAISVDVPEECLEFEQTVLDRTTNEIITALGSVGGNISLPALPYGYDALDPVISPEIMELHHQKHHQAYINKTNTLLAEYAIAETDGDTDAMRVLQSAIRFNGGGHINHAMFWNMLLAPTEFTPLPPTGELSDAIVRDFGSLEAFIEEFNNATAAIQGSGWGWLAYDKDLDRLEIVVTANQDPLEATTGLVPLIGVDVWEHAYYLQYKNLRPDYLKEIWKIMNWNEVAVRFENARS